VFMVFVKGLELYAFHGVPPEEKVVGHRYRIDLEMEVDGSADQTDRVEDTVDYASAAQVALDASRETQFSTLERLGAEIADRLMAKFPSVAKLSVRVAKPLPPAPVIAQEMGILLIRRR